MTYRRLAVGVWAVSPTMDECDGQGLVPDVSRAEGKFSRDLFIINNCYHILPYYQFKTAETAPRIEAGTKIIRLIRLIRRIHLMIDR